MNNRTTMKCPACGHENRAGAKFCRECAAPVGGAISCPKCGTPSERGQKFCDSCGQPIAEAANLPARPDPLSYTPPHLASRILAEQAALEARAAVDGERKTITALFADVKGSNKEDRPLVGRGLRSRLNHTGSRAQSHMQGGML